MRRLRTFTAAVMVWSLALPSTGCTAIPKNRASLTPLEQTYIDSAIDAGQPLVFFWQDGATITAQYNITPAGQIPPTPTPITVSRNPAFDNDPSCPAGKVAYSVAIPMQSGNVSVNVDFMNNGIVVASVGYAFDPSVAAEFVDPTSNASE